MHGQEQSHRHQEPGRLDEGGRVDRRAQAHQGQGRLRFGNGHHHLHGRKDRRRAGAAVREHQGPPRLQAAVQSFRQQPEPCGGIDPRGADQGFPRPGPGPERENEKARGAGDRGRKARRGQSEFRNRGPGRHHPLSRAENVAPGRRPLPGHGRFGDYEESRGRPRQPWLLPPDGPGPQAGRLLFLARQGRHAGQAALVGPWRARTRGRGLWPRSAAVPGFLDLLPQGCVGI